MRLVNLKKIFHSKQQLISSKNKSSDACEQKKPSVCLDPIRERKYLLPLSPSDVNDVRFMNLSRHGKFSTTLFQLTYCL